MEKFHICQKEVSLSVIPLKSEFSCFVRSGVTILNPAFDFIPPERISLLLTDHGGVTPSYVHQLMTEFYSKEDYVM